MAAISIHEIRVGFAPIGPPATIGAGSNEPFQLTFAPAAVGTFTATVTIANDDSDEAPYIFVVEGIGLTPPPVNDDLVEAKAKARKLVMDFINH